MFTILERCAAVCCIRYTVAVQIPVATYPVHALREGGPQLCHRIIAALTRLAPTS